MPLQLATREERRNRAILRMLGQDVALTDLTLSSALRIFYEEALIEEWQALDAGLLRELRDWFIQTAQGAALERRISDFGIARPAAQVASGYVTLTVSADGTVIPAGTALETVPTDGTEPKRYAVLANPDVPGGSWTLNQPSGPVRIAAATAGAAGNTAANTITFLRSGIAAVTALTNLVPLSNGRDTASDDELRQFFRDSLDAQTRGTRASILFYLLNFVDEAGLRPIHSVALLEHNGLPLLNLAGDRLVSMIIYIEDGSGTAAQALVNTIQRLVDGDDSEGSGLRAAGSLAEVQSSGVLPIDVALKIDVDRAFNPVGVKASVDNAVREYLARLPIGGQLITGELQGQIGYAQLFRRVMNVDGVLSAEFDAPTSDVNVPIGRKAMPATVEVTVRSVS